MQWDRRGCMQNLGFTFFMLSMHMYDKIVSNMNDYSQNREQDITQLHPLKDEQVSSQYDGIRRFIVCRATFAPRSPPFVE